MREGSDAESPVAADLETQEALPILDPGETKTPRWSDGQELSETNRCEPMHRSDDPAPGDHEGTGTELNGIEPNRHPQSAISARQSIQARTNAASTCTIP